MPRTEALFLSVQDSINMIALDPKIGLRGERGGNYYELLVVRATHTH